MATSIKSLQLNASLVVSVLCDSGFKVFLNWNALARELQVPLDYRRQLQYSTSFNEDYTYALEGALDYWLKNDHKCSWYKLFAAVERLGDEETTRALRRILNITDSAPAVKLSSTLPMDLPSSENNHALSSFFIIQEKLQPLLQLSINEFASKCFSKDLISMEIYEKLFDHTPSTDSERTSYLIYVIYKRAESFEAAGKWSEARDLIHKFGQTVYDVDTVLRHIGREIMSVDNSQTLLSKQERIKSSIQSSLVSVAVKLMSQDLITDEEYDATTDPDSDNSKRHLADIFRTLREVIKDDYTKYESLFQVLKDLGPPISTAALKLTAHVH